MAMRAERHRMRLQFPATIAAAVLLLGALAVAQDPASAPGPSPGDQAPPTRAELVEQLENRLQEIDDALRTNRIEYLETLPDDSPVSEFLFFTTGVLVTDTDDASRRATLYAQRRQLVRERDETWQALVAARYLEEPSSVSAVAFLDSYADTRPSPNEDLVDTTAFAPTSFSGTSLTMDPRAFVTRSVGLSLYASVAPAGDQAVRAWGEVQTGENGPPLSGPLLLSRTPDGTFFFSGMSADGSTGLSGEFEAPLNSTSEPVVAGTALIRLATSSAVTIVPGSLSFAHRYDGRMASFGTDARGTATAPQSPSLNLTTVGKGGVVIHGRQFSFFDDTNRKVAEGSGTWAHNGGPTLTFRSDRLQVTLDFGLNHATGSYEPDPNAGGAGSPRIDIDVDRLFSHVPSFLVDPDLLATPSLSDWDPTAVATSVATYYSATSDVTPAADADPDRISPRLGVAYGEDLDPRDLSILGAAPVGPARRPGASYYGPSFVNLTDRTARLNPPAVNTLPADPKTQLGAARLVTAPDPTGTTAAGGSTDTAPLVYFKSLGLSTGSDAIEMVYIGGPPLAPRQDNLLVLEPVSRAEAKRVEPQLAAAARGRSVSTGKLVMYCLNHDLLTPAPGQIMRLASAETHQQFAEVVSIWDAADRARQNGALHPDSDPEAYYHSIVQWAIWTKLQGYDERAFGDAFVRHTRRNFEQTGQKWSPAAEKVVRSVVSGRWQDIQTILR